ncbi:MAG: NAD(P)/FAD-dependent oxidoreductase, partial [Planctomycetales bacterium]|nr:NAD(P)/FAD-dependent oxidoreductase [Planctomycetales bacterium]
MYDTIIIGAGLSGLAAGIRLAHYDRRVCILERHNTIGGLNSFYRLRSRDFDVGLHAVTNFTPKGARKGPLARVLRQLRFRWDDLALRPQVGSEIAFPGKRLRFTNDFDLFESEVRREFPDQIDNFQQLLAQILEYDDLNQENYELSTRQILSQTISDPLLIEMILCPLMWYGNARQRDMDFGQFCIMFRSIFLEGFARPFAGVRLILRNLVRQFRSQGGELKLRSGVARILHEDGEARGVELDDGERLEAKAILSSAGWPETMRLCERAEEVHPDDVGQLSFTEAIAVLNCQPKKTGNDRTIVFFNDSEQFHWEKPDELCDVRTGVVCSPNNYAYGPEEGELSDGTIRITALANFDRWTSLADEQYELEKLRWFDRTLASAVRYVPDFRHAIIDTDMFTPKTIRRYTWHDGGTVYGAAKKRLDGVTPVKNLYLCGTDQGYVGIIGAMMSGITM